MRDDAQPLGDGGHHPVLHAVVDHLHEVAGAVGSAVEVALRCRPTLTGAMRRGGGTRLSRRDRLEDRLEVRDRTGLSADHEAVAPLESPHPTARATVDVMDVLLGQLLCSHDVVSIVGIATVDDDVAPVEQAGELVQGALHDGGGNHDPHGPRPFQPAHEILERRRTRRPFCSERLHGVRAHVVHDATVPVAHQSANQIGPHTAEPDHAELHRFVRSQRTTLLQSWFSLFRVLSTLPSARFQGAITTDQRVGRRVVI